ncbi:MAG: NAD(P)-dependent oxidoreductase [Gammaproteobacteria bacterium]|nr:NAD(P)-dependent oxidoreductase [Gammaproteobacteria bacterium]
MIIGFIGLGTMGTPMAMNLVNKRKEDTVLVFARKPAVAETMVKAGAKSASSIKEVGEKADVIITMVTASKDVRAVYSELLPALTAGKITIDMSTIEPSASIEISKQVESKGATMLDCPVVKSQPAAIDGTLGIYAGGNKSVFDETVKDILLCMGNNVIHLGDNGSGLVMKICHNMLVGEIQNGVNEMITMAHHQGIKTDQFVEAISYGGAGNFYLNAKWPNIDKNEYPAAFSLQNMHKDVHIAQQMAQEAGLELPTIDRVVEVYDQGMEKGFGAEDFSSSFKVVANK